MTIAVAASQVPSFLRGAWSDADVTAALAWSSGVVEAYCERDFTYRADDVVLVDPFPARRSAQLPNPPVTAVSLVEGYMRAENGAMAWQTLTNWAWTAEGLLYDTTGQPGTDMSQVPSWPSAAKSLRVTYTHGFQTVPADLVAAVTKIAAGYLANPANVLSRKVGDVEMSWSNALLQGAGAGLDEALLGKYRLITVPR